MFFAACGGDDGLPPTPQKPPTQEETPEVKAADIVKYFALNNQLNVSQALEKAKADLGKKTIDGKEINVTSVTEVKRDEAKGTFTLKVAGYVGKKPFGMEVDFAGFAQKPSDQDMAMRAVAKWKEGVDYLAEFDFDTLYRLKKTDKFTAAYLAKYVDLTSSAPDGNSRYTFTADDWAKTTVSDVKYIADNSHSGRISFTITYNGIKGNTGSGSNGAPSLAFDKNIYYAKQITLDTDAVKKRYMRGVYQHLDIFYTSLLKFDADKFVPYIERKQNLDKELQLATSSDLGHYFGGKFKASADGDKSAQVRAIDPSVWIKYVQFGVRRGAGLVELVPSIVKSENGNNSVTAWVPTGSQAKDKDIYLVKPRIQVTGAKKENGWLYITYKLIGVNDTPINGTENKLPVHLI